MNYESENKCPVCQTPLSLKNIDKYDLQYCSSCRREFYPIEDLDERNKPKYDDIESVSDSNSNDEPVLLSEKSKESKPNSYLRKHFGSSVNIETEIYIPE